MSHRVSGCNVFVANLGPEVVDQDLFSAFVEYGEIRSAKVMRDIHEGTTRGFGFVLFADPAAAQRAISNHKTRWNVQLASHDAFNVVEKSKKVYCRNIPKDFSSEKLTQFFSQFGTVTNITVKGDSELSPKPFRRSSRPTAEVGVPGVDAAVLHNVCFVEFTNEDEAAKCVEQTQGTRLLDHLGPLLTKFAEPPEVRDARKMRQNRMRGRGGGAAGGGGIPFVSGTALADTSQIIPVPFQSPSLPLYPTPVSTPATTPQGMVPSSYGYAPTGLNMGYPSGMGLSAFPIAYQTPPQHQAPSPSISHGVHPYTQASWPPYGAPVHPALHYSAPVQSWGAIQLVPTATTIQVPQSQPYLPVTQPIVEPPRGPPVLFVVPPDPRQHQPPQ